MASYYNEIDPAAAAILRELIARDVIPRGDVDTRSIKEVTPDDIRGYTQCHFFAGGGLWAVAGRLAGWPDWKPWWTGSCPCQGESLAGKRLGADDPRHLWPDFYRLIRAERPPVVMGEQVAAAAGTHWLDGVCADLALEDYAARAVDIPACAVDAPHQRNRLYWAAVDNRISARLEGRSVDSGFAAETNDFLFGDTESERWREGRPEHEFRSGRDATSGSDVQLQYDADGGGCPGREEESQRGQELGAAAQRPVDGVFAGAEGFHGRSGLREDRSQSHGPVVANGNGRNGSWWADAEWIVSPLDDKARRTKPGLPFLVDGLPGRVDLWRVGGNAISPILAAEVVAAFLETE